MNVESVTEEDIDVLAKDVCDLFIKPAKELGIRRERVLINMAKDNLEITQISLGTINSLMLQEMSTRKKN